jgi:hypothetical protein
MGKCAHRSDCAFGFTSYKDLQTRYEKNYSMAKCQINIFLIVIYHSSLVKAAMNAVNCTMVLKKRINFFFFHWPKAKQRP